MDCLVFLHTYFYVCHIRIFTDNMYFYQENGYENMYVINKTKTKLCSRRKYLKTSKNKGCGNIYPPILKKNIKIRNKKEKERKE